MPEGRNHYWRLANSAMSNASKEWEYFHWFSSDILPASEIRAAKRELDELTFQQEYEGSFLNFTGRAYYDFDRLKHCERLDYDPLADLLLMFDFNRAPGVCAVAQEQDYAGRNKQVADEVTGIIGEVWIPKNSTTPKVCRRIARDWGDHKGDVFCYGDASGGAHHSSSVEGSD